MSITFPEIVKVRYDDYRKNSEYWYQRTQGVDAVTVEVVDANGESMYILHASRGREAVREVFLEVPQTGKDGELTPEDRSYAKACMQDSLLRGEAPYVGHIFGPATLDGVEDEDAISACHDLWRMASERMVVYADRGITPLMQAAVAMFEQYGNEAEIRRLVPALEED